MKGLETAMLSSPIVSERGGWMLQAVAGGLVAFHSVCLEAASVTIRHDPPACVLADAFPRLLARVEPPGKAARVRCAFRPEGSQVWHAVAAELTDEGFAAVLPRPRLAAQRIHYRFEATDPAAEVVTSPAYSAEVVADAAACSGSVAGTVPSASVMVDVPPGAPVVPPVPPGFDPVGAVSSAPHKGSSKKKIGVLAGVLIGGGAVAAGVAAASSEPPPSTLALQPTWNIRSSTPPISGTVSVAANSMTAELSVVLPRTLQPGNAWVLFFNQGAFINNPCAVISGNHPLLEAGREARFTVGTPFVTARPCGLAIFAHIVFRMGSGSATVYESGNADFPDASVSYTFVP
ncbi:MAG TPA: hypothetical protein VFQ51_15200 [Vicinamibacteria bacterium]|nr:hypothetical protein [Vicinamibacteria bacterium]